MKTISFKIKTNEELQKVISEDSRICSAMRRYAFNRLQDGVKQREIYQMIVSKFDCNCHLANSALRNANALYTLNKEVVELRKVDTGVIQMDMIHLMYLKITLIIILILVSTLCKMNLIVFLYIMGEYYYHKLLFRVIDLQKVVN